MRIMDFFENGWMPDALTRMGVRRLIRQRLHNEGFYTPHDASIEARQRAFHRALCTGPISEQIHLAEEMPAEFFELVLGAQMKYSCGWYEEPTNTLDEAARQMLALTLKRARLTDGMRILDLGCRYGDCAIALGKSLPNSEIVALTTSEKHYKYVVKRVADNELTNVNVVLANIGEYDFDDPFDRIISVELFESIRNYEAMLSKLSDWIKPDGQLFVHMFCNLKVGYLFQDIDSKDWVIRNFYDRGLMADYRIFDRFPHHFEVERSWFVKGTHYANTCKDWLENFDANREQIRQIITDAYPPGEANLWMYRWRLLFLACAEIFSFGDGECYGVGHYRLRPVRR